jgi:DNA ligase (NAD+)
VVVKVAPLRLWPELGIIGEREPRWAIAYKFAPDLATTRLLEIRINVGRTGSLNPYAVLEPVEIGGAMVKLATLHNFEDVARKGLMNGDLVLVKRAGDVIPQVVAPLTEERTGDETPFVPRPTGAPPAARPSSARGRGHGLLPQRLVPRPHLLGDRPLRLPRRHGHPRARRADRPAAPG